MHKYGLFFIGLLAAGTVCANDTSKRETTFPRCGGSDVQTIASGVKRDYLQNRIPRWADDQKTLGQADPVAWVNVNEMRGGNDRWQVPLTVRGKNTDIHYRVMIDCHKGTALWQR